MDKRTVLVTGGTQGIGKAIVLKFAALGYNIVSCGRNEALIGKLQSELSDIGVSHFVEKCDLRIKEAIHSFFSKGIDQFGGVDVVVNNAGVFFPGKIEEEDDEMFVVMMETNLNATYYISKLSIPYLKKSSSGHLFNICSTASITPYKNGGSYCISKYAQYGLTKVLREELKPAGVRVTAVLPGATRTASWEGTDLPDSRFLKPESIAELVVSAYLLPKDAVIEELLIRPMLGDIE